MRADISGKRAVDSVLSSGGGGCMVMQLHRRGWWWDETEGRRDSTHVEVTIVCGDRSHAAVLRGTVAIHRRYHHKHLYQGLNNVNYCKDHRHLRQWWWMVIVTYESYDSVLVGTGKQKGLESLSENSERRRRCDVERQVVPDGGTRNRKRPPADCRETNGRNFQTMWGRRPQPSSGCHVGNTGETRL